MPSPGEITPPPTDDAAVEATTAEHEANDVEAKRLGKRLACSQRECRPFRIHPPAFKYCTAC